LLREDKEKSSTNATDHRIFNHEEACNFNANHAGFSYSDQRTKPTAKTSILHIHRMADSIPGVFPCCQFPDSECTLWFSTLEAATYAYPPCADVYFPDLVLSTDEDFRSPNDEPHIDESERVITHGSYRSEEGFASVDGERGSDIPVESDSEENIVPSESHDALLEYSKAFPDGHEIIWTPTDGLLCGFNAVVRSMQAMHWYLPCPTVESLQEVFYSPAFVEHATAFGMTNDNNCKSSGLVEPFFIHSFFEEETR